MTLEIIGPGFGRTGTKTTKLALETLGFGPCHHMLETFEHPEQVAHWLAIAAGQPVDWNAVFDGYRSQIDWPGAHVWRDTVAAFPEAKVLHTHRPPDLWWASFSKTIGKLFTVRSDLPLPPHVADMMGTPVDMILQGTFGSEAPDEATAKAAYMRRLDDVRAAVPADRLLVYDVAEGWEPLCAFLGVPVPGIPFPHTNRRDEFWAALGGEPA